MEFIDGIGLVTENQVFDEKSIYNFNESNEIEIVDNKEEILSKLIDLKNGKILELFTSNTLTKIVSKEIIQSLECSGVITTAYNSDYPLGYFALDYFKSELHPITPSDSQNVVFRLSNPFKGKFSISTKKSVDFSFDGMKENSFENINTTAQLIAICTKDENGAFSWSNSFIFPDGNHIQAPLTSTEQYAQSCFEGMVAMTSKEGEIIVLRPYDNAKRLKKSCIFLGIPPISEEQFVESIKAVLKANKDYLAKPFSDNKVYIRPYVKGLEGGYGVGPAYSYAFVIEIFPYRRFINKNDIGANLICIEGKRRSHDGGMGSVKASANYAQTIKDRQLAKTGKVPGYENVIFDDVLYLGEAKSILQLNNETVHKIAEVLDEDAAGNIVFIDIKDDELTFYTPSLERNSILGGFVRNTIIEILKALNYKVIEKNLTLEDIQDMSGAFITGGRLLAYCG